MRLGYRYISDLHERLATLEHRASSKSTYEPANRTIVHVPEPPKLTTADNTTLPVSPANGDQDQDGMEANAPLTNPLAFHITDWVPGPLGRPGAFPLYITKP